MARCMAALALLICFVTIFVERFPARNRFCVATKIPIELMGFEAPLVQWSVFWYGSAFFLLPTYHRMMFYGGLLHLVALVHLCLTLYNSCGEVDWVDFLLAAVDLSLSLHATIFMIFWTRISETAAVLVATAILWSMALFRHAEKEKELKQYHNKIRQRVNDRERSTQLRHRAHTQHPPAHTASRI